MKVSRLILFLMAAWALSGAVSGAEELFHNGGTGTCKGCHTTPPQLLGSDPGSTCLICHQAPAGVSLPSKWYVATDSRSFSLCVQLPQSGDFCWLKKNYSWSLGGLPSREESSFGERHGHNIVALDFGFEADSTLQAAPGGTYPSSELSCISCHDPHGNYRRRADGTITATGDPVIASGSYPDSPDPSGGAAVGTFRLLAGKGYRPGRSSAAPFTADPPAAVAPRISNRSETSGDTRVAYGSGMSEWCMNCHPQLNAGHSHPSGKEARLPVEVINNYSMYLNSGNLTGRSESSYSSLVPFEMGTADYSVLKVIANSDNSVKSGPGWGANVMCLTCHRGHASAWDSIMRWNNNVEFIIYNGLYPGTDRAASALFAQGRVAAETQKSFYDRPVDRFAPFQRGLCNKCHIKD